MMAGQSPRSVAFGKTPDAVDAANELVANGMLDVLSRRTAPRDGTLLEVGNSATAIEL
jgi:uncharacterized protein YejL (UPF0352 family)